MVRERYSVAVRAWCVATLACVLLVAASSCAGASHDVNLTEDWNGKQISLKAGEVFTLRLPENPTTGYRWAMVEAGAPVCVKISDSFSPPADSRMGSPGAHEWRFRAAAPGAATIEMHLVRRWKEDSVTRSFVLRLLVS